ncbi:hypothetical protein TNCV_360401 [Trichonephila clavipes]|nr:hypothetical protein TNCV_360401 [Trichonephila clavipes]
MTPGVNKRDIVLSLDSDESDIEIAVLPPNASELTDEDEGNENEVNTGEIIVKDVLGSLEVRNGDSVSSQTSHKLKLG